MVAVGKLVKLACPAFAGSGSLGCDRRRLPSDLCGFVLVLLQVSHHRDAAVG